MTRKQELLEELNKIKAKEVEAQLIKEEELGKSSDTILKAKETEINLKNRQSEVNAHNFIMRGDFLLKFMIAVAISGAFMYIVWTGSMVSAQEKGFSVGDKTSGLFQLLSVVGPLFGKTIQYYFGKNKAGSNGE